MAKLDDVLDVVLGALGLGIGVAACVFVFDSVQAYRAWPYEQACHQGRLIPDRRPLSASVACLPSAEIPR